ncbi:MAG TPA: methyltransferase domain-containing protein [Bryobacteraceae bacterium]|nr:methyltransferase domain-containing protein [Bryobacteraceae bacterium]
MKARDPADTAKVQALVEKLQAVGWYHSIELPNGDVIPGIQGLEQQRLRLRQFPIPQDLRGKRVLDIGAWDGWFSFEMEKRGASVVAVDAVRNERLLQARELLGSKIDYHVADVCDLRPSELGVFDIVLFLGVLYHLKHPLLALERVCAMSTDLVCVESYVMNDGYDPQAAPVMEFYEGSELAGQFDNWVGPNLACLLAMCRSAGFARVKFESMLGDRAHVSCFRKWDGLEGTGPAPRLAGMANTVTLDLNFSAAKDEYVSLWFSSTAEGLTPDDVFPEVSGYGSRPVKVVAAGTNGWETVFKLPPGLEPGWHPARLRVRDSAWSHTILLALDTDEARRQERTLARGPRAIEIQSATDGETWEQNVVQMGPKASIALWARGLDGLSTEKVCVRLDGRDIPAAYVGPSDANGLAQVNALLPHGLAAGIVSVNIAAGDSVSPPVRVRIVRKPLSI